MAAMNLSTHRQLRLNFMDAMEAVVYPEISVSIKLIITMIVPAGVL